MEYNDGMVAEVFVEKSRFGYVEDMYHVERGH